MTELCFGLYFMDFVNYNWFLALSLLSSFLIFNNGSPCFEWRVPDSKPGHHLFDNLQHLSNPAQARVSFISIQDDRYAPGGFHGDFYRIKDILGTGSLFLL